MANELLLLGAGDTGYTVAGDGLRLEDNTGCILLEDTAGDILQEDGIPAGAFAVPFGIAALGQTSYVQTVDVTLDAAPALAATSVGPYLDCTTALALGVHPI